MMEYVLRSSVQHLTNNYTLHYTGLKETVCNKKDSESEIELTLPVGDVYSTCHLLSYYGNSLKNFSKGGVKHFFFNTLAPQDNLVSRA